MIRDGTGRWVSAVEARLGSVLHLGDSSKLAVRDRGNGGRDGFYNPIFFHSKFIDPVRVVEGETLDYGPHSDTPSPLHHKGVNQTQHNNLINPLNSLEVPVETGRY